MNVFKASKWIWADDAKGKNTHAEFYGEFIWEDGDSICRLSCDSDYALYINGEAVASNQYGDYEHFKSYDSIDITPYLKKGKNIFAVRVWYFGEPSQRYYTAKAGLIFEILNGGKYLLVSDEKMLGRKSRAYISGMDKKITYQLGYSFAYNANNEDAWKMGEGEGFAPCVLVDKKCSFVARPNEKLILTGKTDSIIATSSEDKRHYIVDMQRECVGLPCLSLTSAIANNHILIAFGELLEDGHVKRLIGARDFSFEYTAKAGKNDFTDYCLRLGCRYLELYCDTPIELEYAGLILQEYPIEPRQVCIENDFDRKMYDLSVRSLQLCMMEHYVDTPWREQCLYVYDSRNQALCGYKVFEGGNSDYVRANLKLISQDRREDGLLAICYPCGMDLTIPSFSLYYFIQVNEYLKNTGDITLAQEVYDKLISVLNVFIGNRKDGLVLKFEGVNHWNFYDWSPYLDGALHGTEDAVPDLMINLLFILALQNLREIDLKIGNSFAYEDLLEESKKRTYEAFFNAEKGLYSMTVGGNEYTVLGNALAILARLELDKDCVCEKIVNGEFSDCSLSMKIFKYDALLATDKEKYQEWVLNEIREEYGKMIEQGNTVWETIDGASAFDNAGSLCHGWSAIPVYYYTKLKNV